MAKPDPADKTVNDKLPVTGLSETALSKAYQALKADKPLPDPVKHRIMRQAKHTEAGLSWRSWWYFSQLALGCAAFLLVLSWVNPDKLPTYYQIDTVQAAPTSTQTERQSGMTANKQVTMTVQWHHLTVTATGEHETGMVRQRLQTLKAQQRQLQRSGELNSDMHRQIGLLTRHHDSWQIALCDNKQLKLTIELVQALTDSLRLKPVPQPQWVELQFAPSGHILTIAALSVERPGSQCPAV